MERVWINTSPDDKIKRWGEGPWCTEPDKVQWVDEQTNLDCLIVRNRVGALCGYVGVPPEHPLHGRDYNSVYSLINGLDVHGGLTFSGGCQETNDPSRGICHVPLDGRPDHVWWFGFDCAHLYDFVPQMSVFDAPPDNGRPRVNFLHEGTYRDLDYVKRECTQLARQLASYKET